jgi:hypothetical protein
MARQISQAFIGFALVAIALAWFAFADDDPRQAGPLSLVIQYKCLPANRAEFRRRLIQSDMPNFAQRKADGMFADCRVLFSRYVDTNVWDALALLTFNRYAEVERWRHVEERSPAGLGEGTLALTTEIGTYPVDLMRQAHTDQRAPRPVYLVVPYTYTVATPAYLKYADDYVIPQFAGWMGEGILGGYELYLQRYTAARPWDTLIFLEYKDDESFGQRESVVAKVRAKLQNNPVWKAASDNKQNLRVEKEAVIADEILR